MQCGVIFTSLGRGPCCTLWALVWVWCFQDSRYSGVRVRSGWHGCLRTQLSSADSLKGENPAHNVQLCKYRWNSWWANTAFISLFKLQGGLTSSTSDRTGKEVSLFPPVPDRVVEQKLDNSVFRASIFHLNNSKVTAEQIRMLYLGRVRKMLRKISSKN